MQRPSPRFRSEEYFVYEIIIRRNVLPKIIEICMTLAMLVLTWMSSIMADGNQHKHLLPSFATKARIYSSRNS